MAAVRDGCLDLPTEGTDPSIACFKMKKQTGDVDGEEGERVWDELGGKWGLFTQSHWSR